MCAGTRISNSFKPCVGSCQHQDGIHPLGLSGIDLLGLWVGKCRQNCFLLLWSKLVCLCPCILLIAEHAMPAARVAGFQWWHIHLHRTMVKRTWEPFPALLREGLDWSRGEWIRVVCRVKSLKQTPLVSNSNFIFQKEQTGSNLLQIPEASCSGFCRITGEQQVCEMSGNEPTSYSYQNVWA